MNKLYFEKLADFDRIKEPCTVAVPFPKGKVNNPEFLAVADLNGQVVSQTFVTSRWSDNSVRWLLIHFFADLPANKDKSFYFDIVKEKVSANDIFVKEEKTCTVIDTGALLLKLNKKGNPFKLIQSDYISYNQEEIIGPILNGKYHAKISSPWEILQKGPVTVIAETKGSHFDESENKLIDFILTIQVFKDKDWFKIDYKIINREETEYVDIKSITLDFTKRKSDNVRLVLAKSNYRTDYMKGASNDELYYMIDAKHLIYEPNEHVPEVFYGTFFADWTDSEGGLCASIYQAYQNYPKALKVNKDGISIKIVPEMSDGIRFRQGMAKTHTIFLHFHDKNEAIENINKRALQLQLPDVAVLEEETYKDSKVFPDIFLHKSEKINKYEGAFIHKTDYRAKAFGILNWGDTPDMNYTRQGRGKGAIVWVNNEYDFPHAAMLIFARCGERRMLDYMLVSARHCIDVDVCHYSHDKFKQDGQIIHSAHHVSGDVDISHEWIEGIFDYYHHTGDRFAYETAIKIGHNIKRHLTKPRYRQNGEINARETGWALRALVALYIETCDETWLDDAEFILSHFEQWKEKYGVWLSPYTDHTAIRIPFMISIAVGSLMRYYEVRPLPKIKQMIIEAVDDMVENCMLENGFFYYKEFPSLKRLGNNTTILEALTYAFKFTNDRKYIRAGLATFNYYMQESSGKYPNIKKEYEDSVVMEGPSAKGIAQSFYPVVSYYVAAVRAGINLEMNF